MSMFVPEVFQAIIVEYAAEVIAYPTTPAEWNDIANELLRRWNFPFACDALDGKHVAHEIPDLPTLTTSVFSLKSGWPS